VVSPRLRVSGNLGVRGAALAGLGIARVPEFLVQDEMAEGQLRRVLPNALLNQSTCMLFTEPSRGVTDASKPSWRICDARSRWNPIRGGCNAHGSALTSTKEKLTQGKGSAEGRAAQAPRSACH
jgi:hypothetical protein